MLAYLRRDFRPNVLTFMLLAASASAGFFGGGLIPHGHSSTADGGRITNLTLLGTLTVPGTVTFSSSTIIKSSMTIGADAVYTSTFSYSSATLGGCSVIAYSSVTAVTAITFTGWNSTYPVTLELDLTQNTSAGIPQLKIGGLGSATSHTWNASGFENNVAFSNTGAQAALGSLGLTNALATSPISGSITIEAVGRGKPVTHVRSDLAYTNTGGTLGASPSHITASITKLNAISVSSFTLSASAGTWTGWVTARACPVRIYP